MNKEHTDKLLKDFPDLYKQYYLPMQQTCMCWGFDVNDGWFKLIYDLSTNIAKINPKCETCQVKEKFGGLRFYVDHGDEATYKLISKAEEDSFKICEVCGLPGKLNEEGWISVKCKMHRKEAGHVKGK
jgi:hypothetical protein